MRRVVLFFFLLASCHRSERAPAVSTPQSFIVSAYLAASGDAEVCALATGQTHLRADLIAAARRKNVALPQGMEEKKLALLDNLSHLYGRLFDQGYALAMVQDTRAMLQLFNARVDDPDVRNIITKYRARLERHQRDASQLLNQLGGPPWPNFEP